MKYIFINQCGYFPQMKKQVTFRSDEPVNFNVLKSTGDVVFSGTADAKVISAAAGETDFIGDFSEVSETGMYYISAQGLGESDYFAITPDAYSELYDRLMRFFYLQRCGCELDWRIAGDFAHPACHTSKAVEYEAWAKAKKEGTEFPEVACHEVTGGWHDAGDFGRYIVPAAMTVVQLLRAYATNEASAKHYSAAECSSDGMFGSSFASDYASDRQRKAFAGKDASASETGASKCCCADSSNEKMPEFLEEVKYELDWMLKMQREDGAVWHKVTCPVFCGFVMPNEESAELVLTPVSVTATADFAAACAYAVSFYEPYDREFALKLENAARKAYTAMKKMSLPGGFKNPEGIFTGEYDDRQDEDERYWAAAELYKAFGGREYREDFEKMARVKIFDGYGWANMGDYGNYAYLTSGREKDAKLMEAIKEAVIGRAGELAACSAEDGYGSSLRPEQYVWGSSMCIANNAVLMMDAYNISGRESFRRAAETQLHYLLGRNPMGICYVTGCGTESVLRPHHRPSAFLGKAMPGMVSGGPCSWLADDVAKGILTATPPAKCLADMTGSYSTNEVTIYWNSPVVLLLSLLKS